MTPDDRDDREQDRPRRRDYADDDRPDYEEPHRGVMILVLGILGLVVCPIVGIAAWVMANGDLRAMDEGRMDPEGKQLTQVGKVLGIVCTILLVINMLGLVLYMAVIGLFIGMAPPPRPPVAPPPPVVAPAPAPQN